jgi:hypothetical protein
MIHHSVSYDAVKKLSVICSFIIFHYSDPYKKHRYDFYSIDFFAFCIFLEVCVTLLYRTDEICLVLY